MRGEPTRRAARLAAVAAAGLLAGLLPGTEPASGGQAAELPLAYDCGIPGGSRPVTVELRQGYPASATAGVAFQPGQLTVRVPLPAGVLPSGTVGVSGTASLAATISSGGSSLATDWSGLTATVTPLPGSGNGLLTFTGPVAPVTVSAPGAVVFTAGTLSLDLSPLQTVPASPSPAATPSGGPSGSPGGTALTLHAAAGPGRLAVSCTLAAGQQGQLGTVAVGASAAPGTPGATASGSAGGSPSSTASTGATPTGTASGSAAPGGSGSGINSAGPSASSSASGSKPLASSGKPTSSAPGRPGAPVISVRPAYHSGVDTCPPVPTGVLDPARLPPVPVGHGVHVIPPAGVEFPPNPACAYADGFANVAKLGQATLINDPARQPTLVSVNMTRRFVVSWQPPVLYNEADSLGEMHLPVADSTFLTYGFVPTTAKMEFTSLGLLTIVTVGNTNWNQPVLSTIGGYQSIRIFDVKVNGVPLDVGPTCHTAQPVDLVLHGRQDDYLPGGGDGKPDYTIQTGGPLSQTDLFIPAFTGCGSHGESFDNLFTAAVSGPGNSLNLMQGPLCTPASDQPNGCEPEIVVPDPPRHR
ncbi:hypothetical protein CFP65_6504 [Kitasatospora sp. MMS16-BH015]|uniref:DUF6801 domain-containing protein n=1 Tax=Kitasatospora sp. MMS16-BH015 TaxID=2018025 RepID=UPI000CA21C9B|nr:DUF6801 domain-containing protein [Kitasatospora sp. MMS16-BH015]AUG81157.1 hypothetical protein CFP65_6504 [Kitasatospora sp. MMS16-BH015]